ncbi:hypothetical protein [Micromonospora sp. NBS 11-29]|uniref:hypothetical protein n=1 Tax=Micromonospora sp. NBS 11-29 TaxID=1960879 RepID=UPI0020CECB17|nr:hypothetical protein [Micromonospora sp. NBS 11-29]
MFFLIYTLLLLLGGIAMVAVGVAVKEQGTGSRILNAVVGLAMFAYGFYLLFLFDGGSYRIFFYVFVLPILLIVRAVKARKEAREQAAAPAFTGAPQPGMFAPSAPGQPAAPHGAPVPGYAGGPQGAPGLGYAGGPQGHPATPDGVSQQGYPGQPAVYPPHAPQAHPVPQSTPQDWQPGHPGNQRP